LPIPTIHRKIEGGHLRGCILKVKEVPAENMKKQAGISPRSAAKRASELRSHMGLKIARLLGAAEDLTTSISSLTLYQRTAPTEPCPATYEPGVIVIAQGRKQVDLGPNTFICDPSRFLLTAVDLSIVSRVVDASEKAPFIALMIKVDMPMVRELVSREEIHGAIAASDAPAMVTGEATAEFLGACCRLLDLLDSPKDIPFLGSHIQREIIYRILQGEEGARLRLDCNPRRSEPADGQGHRLDQGEFREAAASGGARTHGRDERFDVSPSLPGPYHAESTSISKAASAAGGTQPYDSWTGSTRRARHSRSATRARASSTVNTAVSSASRR
jgi:AraC-type transcriptional regulator N-terminus